MLAHLKLRGIKIPLESTEHLSICAYYKPWANDARRLASLCGQLDENLRLIEQRLNVEIRSRDNYFSVHGDDQASKCAIDAIYALYNLLLITLSYRLKKYISAFDNMRERSLWPSLPAT